MALAIAPLARRTREFGLAVRAFVFAGMLVARVPIYDSACQIGLVEGTCLSIRRRRGRLRGRTITRQSMVWHNPS